MWGKITKYDSYQYIQLLNFEPYRTPELGKLENNKKIIRQLTNDLVIKKQTANNHLKFEKRQKC